MSWTPVHRLRVQLAAAACVVLAAVWLAVAYQVGYARDDALDAARRYGDNITAVVAEHFSLFARTVDARLKHMRGEWLMDRARLWEGELSAGLLPGDLVNQVLVIDTTGRIVSPRHGSDAGFFAGDREYFETVKNLPGDALHIGKPVQDRVSGKIGIPFYVPIRDTAGRFHGIMAVSLSPDELMRAYKSIDLGHGGFLSLRYFDGTVLVRHSDFKAGHALPNWVKFGEDTPRSGGFIRPAAAAADGVARVFSFRRLNDYPLVVVAAQSLEGTLAHYYEQRAAYVTAGAVVSLVILLLLWMAHGRLKREEKAAADLRASEARYRVLSDLSADSYWEQDAEYRFTVIAPSSSAKPMVKEQSWLGKRRWELPYVGVSEDEWRTHREILEKRQPFRDFMVKVMQGDRLVHVSVSGHPVFDSHGTFKGYRGIAKDMTASKRAEEIETLEHTVTRCLADADSARLGTESVIRAVCEAQDWDCGRYFEAEPGAGLLRFAAAWGVSSPEVETYIEKSRDSTFAPGVGLAGRVWQSGEPIWSEDVSTDPRVVGRALAAQTGIRGAFVIPVTAQGTALGVMAFSSREVRAPEPRLLAAMHVIGSQVGQFVRRKNGEEALRRHGARLAEIIALQESVADEGLGIPAIASLIVAKTQEIVGTGSAAIQFVEGQQFVYQATTEDIRHLVGVKTGIAGNFSGAVVESGRAIRCDDAQDDPRIDPAAVRRAGARSLIGAPLQHEGRVIGVLKVMSPAARAFDDEQLHVLQLIAGIAGSAIQRKRSQDEVRASEERFRSLTKLSSDTYWEQDDQYRFISFAKSSRDWIYMRPPEQRLIGKRRWDHEYVNMTPADWAAHIALLDGRKSFHGLELCRLNDAGEKTWVSVSGEPVFDEAGAFKGYRGVGQDITERKRDEEVLRRFRLAMDTSADMIMLVDRETMCYVDVNAAACDAQGYTREEMLRMGPQDVSPLSREELERAYDATIAGGETMLEATHRRKDGTCIPVEVNRRAVRVGDRWLVVSIVRDISERKRAQALLAESEARFRSLTELSSDWYWEQDDQFRFVQIAGRTVFGGPGQTHPNLGKTRWEAGLRPVDGTWEEHLTLLREHRPFHDVRMRRPMPDGSTRFLSISGEPVFDDDGEFKGYRGVGRDLTDAVRREEELRRFRLAMDNSADMIVLIDRDTMRFVDVNSTACRLLGYTRDELLAMGPQDLLPVTMAELARSYDELIADPSASGGMNTYYRCRDGSRLPFESTRRVLRSGDGYIIAAISRDIRERIAAEEALRRSNERFNLAVRATNDVIWDWDLVSDELWWNENLTKVFGHSRQESDRTAQFRSERIHPEDRERIVGGVRKLLDSGGENWSEEYRFQRSDKVYAHVLDRGHVVRDERGKAIRMIGAMTDISMRKEAEEKLAYLAQFDSLTGLPNRHLFRDRLIQAMARGKRGGKPMAVLFIDLDRFKLVNDTLGHGAGDRLLKEATQRLQGCVRSVDTIGRFGGDEFGAILADLAKPADASLVAQKIINALSLPFDLDGHETYVTASIGITLYPADAGDAGTLIMNADAAMYRAKEQGRNTYQYFTREMNERSMQRVKMEAALRRALERKEFLLHYQPKIKLDSGKVCGFEALLRWQHPERGLVSPVEFIPVLEDTGLIVPVGEWVIREVCTQIREWKKSGLQVPPVAVNLSARQFQQKGLDTIISRVLREHHVEPELLQLELTESLLMKDPESAARTLQGLKESSVKLSVDDFGTGYSSLSYLKRFPIDALKIDRTFIRDITVNPDDAAITLAIISLAHSLKLKVIAEGVETEKQLEFLRANGCDEVQGYLFSRPVGAEQCSPMLNGAKFERARVASLPAPDARKLKAARR